jgi:hypothetical protein
MEKEGKFSCVCCQYKTERKSSWKNHLLTAKHKVNIIAYKKNVKPYFCECCKYATDKKSSFNNHLSTKKHANNIFLKIDVFKYECVHCEKKYKSNAGLWCHEKKCKKKSEKLVDKVDKEMIMKLLEQNGDLQKQIIELSSKPTTMIQNTKNVQNKFNLQVFLNETCKNAMNMSDFIHSLVISNEDFENMGKLGYVQGISNILIRGLNQLDQTERPCHCTDKKRETLYIKQNNVWSKENAKEIMKQVILDVSFKNVKKIPFWKAEHPKCEDVKTQQYLDYITILNQVMTGIHPDKDADIDKIVRNISSSITLDKLILA